MNLPNTLTLIRILLTPFFFTALLYYAGGDERFRILAIIFFTAAALTDAADGLLARLLNQRTALGKFLDPLADKLLLLSGFLGVLFVGTLSYRPPIWVIVIVVFRDLFILGGLLVVFLATGSAHVRPNFLGKLTTAVQMATLIAILLQSPLSVPLWHAAALLTLASCLVYAGRDLTALKYFQQTSASKGS